MANLIAAQSGDFTTASTWQTVHFGSELDSELNTTAVSTSNLDSSTFTLLSTDTYDGVALKLSARAASPTGTFTVTLRDSTTSLDKASLTVNVSDLPANPKGVWVFFKFTSTYTPANSTDNHLIRVVCSNTGSQVTLYRNNGSSSNWSRKIRTTTTQAPAANNHLVISNILTGTGASTAVTVHCDNTATTTWGPSSVGTQGMTIGASGTMTFGQTSGGLQNSTAYYFRIRGPLLVAGGGTLNLGTSGSPVPSSSSITFEFDCANNADSQLKIDADGTLNAYGASKTPYTQLTADYSSGTGITVADTTGWQTNDNLAFTPTGSVRTQFEAKTISTVNSGTSVTLSGALTNSHTGTALPNGIQAYVLNLTRNLKFRSLSTSLRGSMLIPAAGGTVTVQYAEFVADTWGTNSSNNHPIDIQATTNTVSFSYCSINPGSVNSGNNNPFVQVSGTSSNNFTIDHFVGYGWQNRYIYLSSSTTGSNWSVTNNCIVAASSPDGTNLIEAQTTLGTFTGNITFSASSTGTGITFFESGKAFAITSSSQFSGNQAWYCNGVGMQIGSNQNGDGQYIYVNNCAAYRCGTTGIKFLGGFRKIILNGCDFMGNAPSSTAHAGVRFDTFGTSVAEIIGCTFSGDTTLSSSFGIINCDGFNTLTCLCHIYNSTFGVSNGIRNAHTTADFGIFAPSQGFLQVLANGCTFSSSTLMNNLTDSTQQMCGDHVNDDGSYVRIQKYNGTTGDHRTYAPQGIIQTDSTVYHTASPSQKLTPNTASYKLRSGPQQCSVSNGVNRTVSVYVRRSKASTGDSADYNGNHPRLVVRRNDAIGLTADTVLQTGSAAVGTWEQLSGTVTSPTDDGAIEVYVDCDGTAGFINVDDYSIS